MLENCLLSVGQVSTNSKSCIVSLILNLLENPISVYIKCSICLKTQHFWSASFSPDGKLALIQRVSICWKTVSHYTKQIYHMLENYVLCVSVKFPSLRKFELIDIFSICLKTEDYKYTCPYVATLCTLGVRAFRQLENWF